MLSSDLQKLSKHAFITLLFNLLIFEIKINLRWAYICIKSSLPHKACTSNNYNNLNKLQTYLKYHPPLRFHYAYCNMPLLLLLIQRTIYCDDEAGDDDDDDLWWISGSTGGRSQPSNTGIDDEAFWRRPLAAVHVGCVSSSAIAEQSHDPGSASSRRRQAQYSPAGATSARRRRRRE